MKPGSLNFPEPAFRHAPYLPDAILFQALDFTGATFKMQFRRRPGDTGDALITLTNSSAPTQGLSVAVTTTDGIPASALSIRIDQTTLEALPGATRSDGVLLLHYDLHVTLASVKRVWLVGTLIVNPGVTE